MPEADSAAAIASPPADAAAWVPPPVDPQAEALLQQPLRRRLLDLIQERPGVHASELCRQAGEPWGTVQYHLSLLRKTNLVSALDAGRERRLFPIGMDPAHARLLAILNHGRRGEIAAYIQHHPGSRQVDICDAVDVTRKTFRLAVRPLVDEHLVFERRGLQSTRYFPEAALEPLLHSTPPHL
jgi:predicted transcriptional regulator